MDVSRGMLKVLQSLPPLPSYHRNGSRVAIIGLGKTRQPEAFVVLHLLEAPGKSKLHKTVLHALGHLANRAAQKATRWRTIC